MKKLSNKFWIAGRGKDIVMGGNLDKAKNLKIEDPIRSFPAKAIREKMSDLECLIDGYQNEYLMCEDELKRRKLTY